MFSQADRRSSAFVLEDWRKGPEMNCARQRKKLMSIRHMEQAMALLDEIDEGDLDPAAYLERALTRAKKELRESVRATNSVVNLNRSMISWRRLQLAEQKRVGRAVVGRRGS
jgi:hypothetical protein